MLSPKKKISKKEMKVDPLISTYSKVTKFYYDNKKYLSYGLTGIIIIVLAVVFYLNNVKENNEIASAEVGKIFPYFDQGNYDVAVNGRPEAGIKGLKVIVEDYGSTTAGNFARFYLANAYFALGETDQALEQYNKVSLSDNYFKSSVLAGIGACYERKADYKKAAGNYEKASAKSNNPSVSLEYLSLAGKNYGLFGEKEKAVEIFNRIKKDNPTHPLAREVDRYIAEFSVN